MAQVDGSLNFDTSIDSSGFSKGISKLSSAATKGLAAAGTALVGVSGYALKVGSDFEAAMSRVAGISGATGKDLERLEETAKELGSTTKFSATEAAEAMENLASAGFTTNEIIDATPGLMDLAAAAGEDLASSADIAASTLRGFGLEASEAGHVADVLAENANRTNAAVADTGEAMKYVAPVAKAMGISMEETAAAIGLLSNAGIKGSQAGTTLRGALTRLVKPTEDMEGVMEELGITFFDNEGKMKSLTEIIDILQDSTKDLTDEQKNNALAVLFGQEALSGMLALINEGPDALDELTTAYENCDGAAADTAKTMNDNLKGSLDELESAMEGAGITAYKKFEKPIRKAVQGATEEISDLDKAMSSGKLSDSMDTVAEGLGTIAETALGLATDAIPVLIDGFAFIVDNGQAVITTAGAIGGALLAMKMKQIVTTDILPFVSGLKSAAQAAADFAYGQQAAVAFGISYTENLTVMQAAVGLVTGKISLATAATTAWNSACTFLGGPLGILITTIGAVTVGAVALAASFDQSKNSLMQTAQAVDDAKKSYEEIEQTKAEAIETNMEEANHLESLRQKLDTIVDANGRVKKGYEGTAEYIINTMNEALGTNIEIVDGVIQKYDEASQQMSTYIEKMKAQAVLEAQAEALKQAEELYDKNAEEIANTNAEIEKYQADLNKRMAELRDQGLSDQEIYNNGAVTQDRELLEHYQSQKQELEDVQIGIIQDKATYYSNLELMQEGSLESLKKINQSEIAEYNDQGERIADTLEEQYAEELLNLESHQKALAATKDEARKKEIQADIEASKKHLEDLENQLNAEKDTLEYGLSELSALAKEKGMTITDSVAQGIRDGSYVLPESIKGLQNLITYDDLVQQATDAGIKIPQYLATGVANGQILPANAIKVMQSLITFDDVLVEAKQAGISIPPTISEGINSGAYMPAQSVQELEDLIEYDDMIQQASDAGVSVPQSVSDGIKSGELKPADAVKQMNNLVSFNDLLEKSDNAGYKVPDTLQKKILEGKMKPSDAVQVVEDLVEFEDLLEKSDQAGKDVPDEIYNGIIEGKLDPQQAVKQMNEYTKNELDKMGPSAKQSGKNMTGDYSEGVGDNKKKQSVGTMAAKVAQYAVDKGLETVSAYNSGTYFVQGFVNGMNDWKTIAINTASNIAISALNALRAAGGEGSPWKTTTRSGRWFGEGFTNGIDEMTDEAERSAEQMSTRTIEALEKAQKKNIFDAYTPEQLDKAFDKLRAASNNITNRIVESAMVPSSKNLRLTRKDSSSSIFPRQIELIGGGKQTIILQLQNGQEIAHWLAPDISKELGIMR